MGFNLEDGTGRGNSAGVDKTNRLLVRSIGESVFQNAAEEGEAYFLGTPNISYTVDTEVAAIRIKNNEDDPLVIGNFFFLAEGSTAGNYYTLSWYKNSGDITNATDFTPLNQNFGSSQTLDGTFQYGNGSTSAITGTPSAILSFPQGEFIDLPANLVLEKGSDFCITLTPPTGNVAMNFYVGCRSIKYIEQY